MSPTFWLLVHLPVQTMVLEVKSCTLRISVLGIRGHSIPGLWNKYKCCNPVLVLIVTAGNGVAARVLPGPWASGPMSTPLMGLDVLGEALGRNKGGSDDKASFTAL